MHFFAKQLTRLTHRNEICFLLFAQRQTRSMHSMAEHEMEMIHQIMSVPPNPPGVAPPPILPPSRVMPPPNVNTSVPPPPLLPTLPPMNAMPQPNWSDDVSVDNGSNINELPSLMSMKVDRPDDIKSKSPSEVVLPKALEDVLGSMQLSRVFSQQIVTEFRLCNFSLQRSIGWRIGQNGW